MNGPIIGTSNTLTHPLGIDTQSATTATTPAPSVVPFVLPQAAREDGSLIHVVQPGDAVHSIAFAYKVSAQIIIEDNQLTDGGRWIFPGQELIIHAITSPEPEVTSPELEEPAPEPQEARATPRDELPPPSSKKKYKKKMQ